MLLYNTLENIIKTSPKSPSYRNQSIDLFCKSVDWFLYDGNFGETFIIFFKALKIDLSKFEPSFSLY